MKSTQRTPGEGRVAHAEGPRSASRRSYESPRLDRYGTLAELTRTSNTGAPTDIFLPGSGGGG